MRWAAGGACLLCLALCLAAPARAGEIHDAARAGDLARIESLLARDTSLVADRDADGRSPLHVAVVERRLEAAAALLARGARVDARDAEQYTPLHRAAFAGDSAALRLLLAHGADHRARDVMGRTPLRLACGWGRDVGAARVLIDAGADVNDRSPRGEDILVSTLFFGKPEIIDLLLDRGARIPDDGRSIGTAIAISAGKGLERVFRLGVEQAERKGMEWWSDLGMHTAARGGSTAVGEALLAKGVPVGEKNQYGGTPLHVAAGEGRTGFAEFLLAHGAKLDQPDRRGRTALNIAREKGFTDLADRLLAKGASSRPARFPELRGPYIGQPAPADTPRCFAPGIVSDFGADAEHSPAVFSPDGREVYWTAKFRGPILFMKQHEGAWTPPTPAPFNSSYGDGEPILSPDGKRLYFLSMRPLEPGGASGKENIWWVERTASGWSEPRPVSPEVNAFDHHWLFSVAADGTLYFSSARDGGVGGRDLYRARFVDGRHVAPENLGPVVNSAGDEHMPFVAPDQDYLIFVSRGLPPAAGRFQFFISYRGDDGAWGAPIPLAGKVPTGPEALCPAVTPDGRYLFYIGQGDIWWVRADFIEALRPKKVTAN